MSGFRHLDDRIVHQGYIWHVAVGTYQAPDGSTFTRDIVRSPGAVGVVPLLRADDGSLSVVLVRQYRAAYDTWLLEIPAGMRDVPDEDPADTAHRELQEETGLQAGSLSFVSTFFPAAGMTDSVLHLYVAEDLVQVERSTHGPEEDHMEIVVIALDEALAMVDRGEINDAKSVIGLLQVDRRLRQPEAQ